MKILVTILLSVLTSLALLSIQDGDVERGTSRHSIELGRQIYTTGIGEGHQKIIAQVSGRNMPGAMMACANCHGACGTETVLQGVGIPDIRKSEYIRRHMSDSQDQEVLKNADQKLKKAIALGIRHDGEEMHRLMPRYQMSLSDMNHLLEFLSHLGREDSCNNK